MKKFSNGNIHIGIKLKVIEWPPIHIEDSHLQKRAYTSCERPKYRLFGNLPEKLKLLCLRAYKMKNIDFRPTHVFKSLFSIKLSLK